MPSISDHKKSTINMLLFVAYAKGHEKERFSPITGDKYPNGKNHNSTNLEVDVEEDSSRLKVPNTQRDQNSRYNNNRRNDRGKFLNRSQSPYARDNKGKDKQPQNSSYKGKKFDENFNSNKSKEPAQSTSKEKV